MTDDEAHEVRTAAHESGDEAHADRPQCAWPDGCAHTPPTRPGGGRQPAYCGELVDGVRHNRTNALTRRRQLAARTESTGSAQPGEPVRAGEPAFDLSARSAGQQAQAIAEILAGLPDQLARYHELLQQVGDVDAAGQRVEAIQAQAQQRIAAAERARTDAEAAAAEVRTELRIEVEGREDADLLAERAQADAERARTEAADARQAAEDAQADAERARAQADADAHQVRADRDRILTERQAAHEDELQRVRDQAAHDIEEARTRADRDAEAARRDAHEADQARARAEQRAHDAEQQMQWLREQLTQAHEQHRADVADLRADAAERVRTLTADLDRLRGDRGPARGAEDTNEHNHDAAPTEEELAAHWSEGLPSALVTELRALAEHGQPKASSKTGINPDLASRLNSVHTGVRGKDWSVAAFRSDVLPKLRTASVQRQLRNRSPQLAEHLERAQDLATRYLRGEPTDTENGEHQT